MSRPARLCSISTAPRRERRTAAARRWKVPCTTNSFSVVRTTRVRSHIQTARSTIRAPAVWSRTPAIEAGQPIAMQPRPTAARPSARTNGPASTIACRRSSRQTRSQPEVIIAFALSPDGERSLVMKQTAQRVALSTLIVIAIVAVALALWKVKLVLALVFLAFILAAALRPGIERLARAGIPRGLGLLIHYVALIGLIALALWIVVLRAVDQVQNALGGTTEAQSHEAAKP